MRKVFRIRICGLPEKAVHPTMRSEGWLSSAGYSLFLTCKGRLANREGKAANLDSKELAERLLHYWMPQLQARGWGDFRTEIDERTAGKLDLRWIERSLQELQEMLSEAPQCPEPTKPWRNQVDGRYAVKITGLSKINSATSTVDSGYLKSASSGRVEISTEISDAKRYATEATCKQAIDRAKIPQQMQAQVVFLNDEDIQAIEDAKSSYWNSALGRD